MGRWYQTVGPAGAHRWSDPRSRHAAHGSSADADLKATLKAPRIQGGARVGQARALGSDVDRRLRLRGRRPQRQANGCVASSVIDLRPRVLRVQQRLRVMRPWIDDQIGSFTGATADRRHRSKVYRVALESEKKLSY